MTPSNSIQNYSLKGVKYVHENNSQKIVILTLLRKLKSLHNYSLRGVELTPSKSPRKGSYFNSPCKVKLKFNSKKRVKFNSRGVQFNSRLEL